MEKYIKLKDALSVIDRFLGYLDQDMIYRIKHKLEKDCDQYNIEKELLDSFREESELAVQNRDRSVSVFCSGTGLSVNVYPWPDDSDEDKLE